MAKKGRPERDPVYYTEEQLTLAIDLAVSGAPLKVIVGELLTDPMEFWTYRQEHLDFANSFERARQEGLEHLADSLMTLDDEIQDVQRARLKSDNYKWLLSKRKPLVYGDRVDVNVNQTIDIGTALSEARQRALPEREVLPLDKLILNAPVKNTQSEDPE